MAQTGEDGPGLRIGVDGGIATITIDNPTRMNALTAAMWGDLPRIVGEADANPAVRVVVIRGAGRRAFSAGADISEFDTARSGEAAATYDALNHGAFETLAACRKPTIAMIHGFCLGGGLGLALCCDLRLADDAAQFAIPAAKLGIGYNPRWVRPLLAAVSAPSAKEILFTGRRFAVAEARQMGLANRVVAADQLEAETVALATEIATNAPLSIAASKAIVDEIVRHPEATDVAPLDRLVAACFASEDYAEGRRAFLEKRKPVFKGR